MGARLDPGGVFEFPNVAPGDYVMRARRPYGSNPHTEGEFASQFITVTGTDIEGLIVHASEGSTISGHVTLDGMGAPRRDAIEFSAIPFDPDVSPFGMGNFARAEIRDDWTFELNGISGPRRFRLANAPDGWALKSVLAHGIDVTDVILPFGTKQQSI